MTMRRSTRLRGSAGDTVNVTPTADDREVKRIRRTTGEASERQVGRTEAVEGEATRDAASSLAWRYATLTPDKRAEWDLLLKAQCFLHVPSDFYDVFELACHLSPEAPIDAFVHTIGVRLIGPFELLARAGETVHITKPLHLHGRYSLDPPEVVSVVEHVDSATGAHWAYLRDAPSQMPTYIVHTANALTCTFEPVAASLSALLHARLEDVTRDKIKNASEVARQRSLLGALVTQYLGDSNPSSTATIRTQRGREVIAPTLNGLGIAVPYNAAKQSGFRELPIMGQALRELLVKVCGGDSSSRKKLNNLITRATIANDECDFGTSLQLGLDLLSAGASLQKEALQLLRVAYMLLGRKQFATVASEHAKHRTDDCVAMNCLRASGDASTAPVSTLQLP